MNCTQCGHPETDHGPDSGRRKNEVTGEWDVVIPGRLCYYMENQGYSQDLCPCTGFNRDEGGSSFEAVASKAGLRGRV